MNLFSKTESERTMPFTPPPTEIKFLPDATYPPRLLLLDAPYGRRTLALWLHPQQTVVIWEAVLAAKNENNVCTLSFLENKKNEQVWINGEKLQRSHILKDGDFIRLGNKARYIYQHDPVRDRRERLEKDPIDSKTLQGLQVNLTPRIAQNVCINAQGVSLDGGVNFGKWEQIASFVFGWDNSSNKYSLHIVTIVDSKLTDLPTKFKNLTNEVQEICKWLVLAAPFDLPLWDTTHLQLWNTMPDAYCAAANMKILQPAREGKRELPDAEEFIMASSSKTFGWIQHGLPIALGSLFAWTVISKSAGNYARNHPDQAFAWFLGAGEGALIFLGMILALWLLFKFFAYSEYLEHQKKIRTYKDNQS